LRLRPGTATAIVNDVETEVDIESVQSGMILVVKPGEKIPADGKIIDGTPSINESMVTGESIPIEKGIGDQVIGGSINGNRLFKFRVTGAGEDTFLAGIIRLVTEAQGKKAPVQRLADRIAGIFVPVVLLIAIITFAAWLIFDPTSPLLLTAPVAVLIIACPCALGLATPTAILAGTGRAARRGIYIRGGDILEEAVKATHVVFDKTGTLTEGKFSVTGIHPLVEAEEGKMLQMAASAESGSNHPLAVAIKERAKELNLEIKSAGEVEEFPGFGLKADIGGHQVLVGNAATMERNSIDVASLKDAARSEMAKGQTVIYVATDGQVLGFISLADKIREEAPGILGKISQSGREVIILTGDNHQTAAGVAASIGVDKFEAEVKPDQKSVIIDTYRRAGHKVMMVGDGINDAPALAAADVGVAMGSGTDVAIESADIILVQSNLESLLEAIKVSEMTYSTIKQNLFWAFFYNIIAIPLAAGLFYPLFGWSLSPVIAAGAMAFSSLFVVTNSIRLLKVDIK
jgi:Cu+-exporting ATPase